MNVLSLSSNLFAYDELIINTLELRIAAPQLLTCTSVRKAETVALARKLSKPGYTWQFTLWSQKEQKSVSWKVYVH